MINFHSPVSNRNSVCLKTEVQVHLWYYFPSAVCILFQSSLVIFSITTLNSFLARLSVSTSILLAFALFVWNVFFYCLIFPTLGKWPFAGNILCFLVAHSSHITEGICSGDSLLESCVNRLVACCQALPSAEAAGH